jgi:poly(3-hydroxybutyrate) depolymerase
VNRRAALVASLAVLASGGAARADDGAREVRLAPSSAGVLGAWLVAGPFKGASLEATPAGVDEGKLEPVKGAALGGERDLGRGKRRPPASWQVASSGDAAQDPGLSGSRTIDLRSALEDGSGTDLLAYAAGRLHVERAGRHYLLLGVDDGVRVFVDGKIVLSRDEARPVRDDDDLVALDLSAGDHDLVLKLHQREGAWAFRAKIVDAALAPPAGSWLALPGTDADDAARLAARMSWVVLDRAFDARGARYRPVLTVRYPEGAPRGVDLPVAARLAGPPAQAFDVHAGSVAVGPSGPADLVVALPPLDPLSVGAAVTLETTVAGRSVDSRIAARPSSEQALVRAERALSSVTGEEPWLAPGSLDSVRHLAHRLARFVARGDADVEAQVEEARELDRLASNLERGADPYEGRTGPMRRAIVTPFDGAPSELGLYVPPSYRRGAAGGRRYPLVVGLHGMRSYPMSFLRALFGLDDPKKGAAWKDRHPLPRDVGAYPAVDAFVITPYAHGDTMYREIGEDDVLHMIEWARRVFPIDETRITVTGVSMGGIGAASLPFHFPHVFAAAEPLCGYHSYLIRPEIARGPKRPWERLLLEERSNVLWAENGEHLPLWIVHGTRDLPAANSGVLIDRYEQLRYSIKHDHPDLGHDVWGITYGELRGMKWLLSQRLDLHPARVRFRTMRTRYASSAWVTVDELATESSWGDVDARIKDRSSIALTTSGVSALTLRRDERRLDAEATVHVTVDRAALDFAADEPIAMHREGGAWVKGAPAHERPVKRGHVSGPIRDAFHEPLLFVYAADEEARVNERVARGLATRPGVSVSYPVVSDADFLARGEPLGSDRALFLVGRTNRVLAALDAAASKTGAPLPMHVDAGGVTLGAERFTGTELGGAFIHPNPLRPERYVVVVAGSDAAGTLRALSLPDLLPDFVVWDHEVARARGKLLLGAASLRAGGFFRNDWSLPARTADPLATGARPSSTAERDGEPPLP